MSLHPGDRVTISPSAVFWLDQGPVSATLIRRALKGRGVLHSYVCECWWVRYDDDQGEHLRYVPVAAVHPRPLRHWEMQDRRWWILHRQGSCGV